MAEDKKIVVDIPEDVKAKHGELVEMIMSTESMNNEERQYWIDLLPVMTPEQVQNLYDILDNERKKLAEIDSFYSKKVSEIEKEEAAEKLQEERKNKMNKLEEAEAEHEKEEAALEKQLLEEMENL
jgi:predicted ribosome quality control (RQC) complex YloA/Tae2 family protein